MKAFLAQLRAELTLSLRNGEQLLVAIFIPLGILVLFSQVDVIDLGVTDRIQVVAPAVLSLAVMSVSLVSLGIGTGFERYYGVLKRLGATPLGRPRWILAKLAMVVVIEILQWAILVPTALALGWHPADGWLPALAAALLGTMAFGGLGLALAGRLPGLTNLAVCNGLYLVLMMTGDMIFRIGKMPQAIVGVARSLPAAPLTDIISSSLTTAGVPHGSSWPVLIGWAVALPALAAATFRWQ